MVNIDLIKKRGGDSKSLKAKFDKKNIEVGGSTTGFKATFVTQKSGGLSTARTTSTSARFHTHSSTDSSTKGQVPTPKFTKRLPIGGLINS
jgi:hypothetical protein